MSSVQSDVQVKGINSRLVKGEDALVVGCREPMRLANGKEESLLDLVIGCL